ncbi:MAG: cell division protein FtsQ [Prevotella sp.]|jgi:cell division protein FtsQ|nr:cell division protein FtsQ [Prevotella sp.]
MTYNWKKSALIAAAMILGAYLCLAVTALNQPDDEKAVCTQVDIVIADGKVDGFLGASEIKEQLQRAKIYPQGQPMKQIDVRKIEEVLQKNPFVKNAEVYKSQGSHVKILLTQRVPVVRVKADNGDDYYIDERGEIMPNTRYASELVIATGAVTRPYAKKHLTQLGNYVLNSDFWHSQIEQFHVLPDGTVEMVPRIGDHIVYLGAVSHIDQKFDRLEKFYRYGLSVAGWNKYSYINMEFDNQIICKKRKKIK